MWVVNAIMMASISDDVENIKIGAIIFAVAVVGFIVMCILGSLFGGKTFGDVISKGVIALVILGVIAAFVFKNM